MREEFAIIRIGRCRISRIGATAITSVIREVTVIPELNRNRFPGFHRCLDS